MSFYKAFKALLNVKMVELRNVILDKREGLYQFMNNFYELTRKKHLLEKKGKNTISLELLLCLSQK